MSEIFNSIRISEDAEPPPPTPVIYPPCPRVNTWAEGYEPGPFLTTAQNITLVQPKDAEASGIDIFFWNDNGEQFAPQGCEFTATGNYTFSSSLAGEQGDQTKYQLRYTEPGDYEITIRIYNIV